MREGNYKFPGQNVGTKMIKYEDATILFVFANMFARYEGHNSLEPSMLETTLRIFATPGKTAPRKANLTKNRPSVWDERWNDREITFLPLPKQVRLFTLPPRT